MSSYLREEIIVRLQKLLKKNDITVNQTLNEIKFGNKGTIKVPNIGNIVKRNNISRNK